VRTSGADAISGQESPTRLSPALLWTR
jgi:hypothetical protein